METKSGRLAARRNAKIGTAGMPLSRGSVFVEEQEAGSWRTTQGGRQHPLEEHGLATVRAEHVGRGGRFGCFRMGLRRRGGGVAGW